MNFGEIVLFTFGIGVIVFIIYSVFIPLGKEEQNQLDNFGKSLSEEFIIDPETGAKLTLEQAQTGIWDLNEVEYYNPENDPLITDEYYNYKNFGDYYENQLGYTAIELEENVVDLMEGSLMFQKYQDWFFIDSFAKIDKQIMAGFIAVSMGNIQSSRTNTLFYWIQGIKHSGHYRLYELSLSDKSIIKLSGVEATYINNYFCEPIKKTFQENQLFKLFDTLTQEPGLEIELLDNNLLIKTKREVSQKDIDFLEVLMNRL